MVIFDSSISTCAPVQVQERLAQLTAQRLAEACVHCTFHPSLSQRSLRMAGRMEAGFQARQQQLLLKRQKMVGVSPTLSLMLLLQGWKKIFEVAKCYKYVIGMDVILQNHRCVGL